jgi:hypothetical protein
MEQQQKQKKQNKTNKQKSNAAANYLFFLFCQTVPSHVQRSPFLALSVSFRVEDY